MAADTTLSVGQADFECTGLRRMQERNGGRTAFIVLWSCVVLAKLLVAARLPLWWRTALGQARSFVILPLCRNGDPVGFLYGDWLGDLPQPQLDQSEFDVLNDLRQLVVAQIDRRREPAAAGR